MKKILFLSLAIFLLQVQGVHAATVSTYKTIVKCPLTGPCPGASEISYECDSTFTTNKDAYAPSENVIINVSQAGSSAPLVMDCISEINPGSAVTGTPQPLNNNGSLVQLGDGGSWSHAAPSAPGNYTQSVSADYKCKPAYPNCEMSGGQQAYAFPDFSEAFLPFTVSSYECNDGIDNADPEDTLADSADPGCHSDYNASNGASYIPTNTSEINGLPPTINVIPHSAQAFIRQMAQIFLPSVHKSNWS